MTSTVQRMAADLLGAEEVVTVARGSIPRWAVAYGYKERQIKNWLALGRAKGELPPFDVPGEMEAWAGKYLERVPGRLLEAIARLKGETAPAAVAEERVPVELPDVSGHDQGLEASLMRFRRSEAMAHALHDQALKDGRHNDANRYMEQAREISGEVRQLEKLVQAQRAEAGEWMRTVEVKQVTGEFLGVMKRALLGRGERVKGRFANEDPGKVWREEVAAVFAQLCESGFAEGLVLE